VVNPLAVAPLSSNVKGGLVCVNTGTGNSGVVTLTALCSGTDVPQWYNNNTTNGGVPLFSGTSYSPTISQSTTYYVGCKTAAGCENLASSRVIAVEYESIGTSEWECYASESL
jgi:hypothetical protein